MRSKKTDSLITGLGGEKKILENHSRLEKYLLYQLVTDDIQQREENFRSATDEIRDAMLATERSPRHRILIWRANTETLNHLAQELPPDLYTYPFWGPTQTWQAAVWLTRDRFYRRHLNDWIMIMRQSGELHAINQIEEFIASTLSEKAPEVARNRFREIFNEKLHAAEVSAQAAIDKKNKETALARSIFRIENPTPRHLNALRSRTRRDRILRRKRRLLFNDPKNQLLRRRFLFRMPEHLKYENQPIDDYDRLVG